MDIEHLNKTQMILLALLVSFVTSIATGIATVSLIEKAPADVTRVISRIVEQPIETILPGEKEVVTQTVVVQESDLIAQAIVAIRPSIVRIYQGERSDKTFLAFGVILDEKGTVLADATVVKEKKPYVVVLDDGIEFEAIADDAVNGVVLLTPNNAPERATFIPAAQEAFSELALGQTVVALGNSNGSYTVSPGIISEIVSPSAEEGSRGFVRTTITSNNIASGSPLVTVEGKIVGIAYPVETGLFRGFPPR
ncbi:MAG: hypothetical protein AMXMBFR44_6020 [Candidatus Campbellbacteria bacterium]